MPMAVWYFNKARVYIKTHMPFPAKFHTCFEEWAELERINEILDYQVTQRQKNTIIKAEKLASDQNSFLICTAVFFIPLFLFFWSYERAACEREGFLHGIVYVENDRHAACAPNVSTCATGRSPKQTAESVPLVQLWLMGSRADSWAQSFSPTFQAGPAGAHNICSHIRLRDEQNSTSDSQSNTV